MAITRSNIAKVFAKSGINPLDCRPLLNVSRPISYLEPCKIISVEDMSKWSIRNDNYKELALDCSTWYYVTGTWKQQ